MGILWSIKAFWNSYNKYRLTHPPVVIIILVLKLPVRAAISGAIVQTIIPRTISFNPERTGRSVEQEEKGEENVWNEVDHSLSKNNEQLSLSTDTEHEEDDKEQRYSDKFSGDSVTVLMQNNGHTTFLLLMEVAAKGQLRQCNLHVGKTKFRCFASLSSLNPRRLEVCLD